MIGAAVEAGAAFLRALMPGAAPAPVADPLAANDFAMMMAGAGTSGPTNAADAASAASDGDDATARQDDERPDDQPQSPDARLLAMLALLPHPEAPPTHDAPATTDADVQAPASVSSTAQMMAAALEAPADPVTGGAPGAGAPGDAGDPPTDTSATKSPQPIVAATTPSPLAPIASAASPAAAPALAQAASHAVTAHAPPARKDEDAAAPIAALASDAAPALAQLVAPPPAHPAAVPHDPSPAQASVATALGEQHLTIAQGSGWLDQLARDIAATAGADGKMHFRLNPDHLGSLQVEVMRGSEGASVRMTTQTVAARDILVDAQPRLVAEARAQGVRIAGTHVDLGGQGHGQGWAGGERQAAPQPAAMVAQLRAIGAAATVDDTQAEPRGAASERYA